MTQRMKISATQPQGFWRCGTFFSKAGGLFEKEHFSDAQWEILKAEPMLRMEAATKDAEAELAAWKAKVTQIIKDLPPEQFQSDGKPRVDAINAALPEGLPKITAPDRDAAWADLTASGFKAPEAQQNS